MKRCSVASTMPSLSPITTDTTPTTSPAVIGYEPVEGAPGVAHLAVAGELCLSTSPEFETVVSALGDDTTVVVVDLSAVTFIDCSGVHAILDAAATLRAANRRLVLVHSSAVIERLFELAGVRDEVDQVSDSSELRALASA
jgi:anti-sigma B factor antagonist